MAAENVKKVIFKVVPIFKHSQFCKFKCNANDLLHNFYSINFIINKVK